MSLQTVSTFTASGSNSPIGIYAMSGDFPFNGPWCDCCGNTPCSCFTAKSVDTTDYTLTVISYTCHNCGVLISMGQWHVCQWSAPNTGTAPVMIPSVWTAPPVVECVLCDKPLEADDKKVCKDCRGVFEAWKFLTKKPDPEPEE
jgi:hypothetical protein